MKMKQKRITAGDQIGKVKALLYQRRSQRQTLWDCLKFACLSDIM